jgi:GDP-mannose 4,6-dehydratase
MRAHLKAYQEEIMEMVVGAKKGDIILDIGSNDSTMLNYYDPIFRRIGIDPTGKQFAHYYGDVELIPTYFTRANFLARVGDPDIRCKVITSISMFYDLPDPVQFAQDVHSILEEDGLWSIELSYLPTMIKTNSLDTICHEHLEYYALHQIREIARRARFQLIDVKFNDCNGGSFRIYLAKDTSAAYTPNTELITTILQDEIKMDIANHRVYRDFMAGCDKQLHYLKDFITGIRASNKTVYIYGASTKGNCILQYANIGERDIPYAVERNSSKIGKMTSTGIPIIGEEEMRHTPPDYLFVLPWHFKKEIVEREAVFLEGGGQIIFALPEFVVVSARPKVLITGCDGMIAKYVADEFKDASLYGFARSYTSSAQYITKFAFDMNDTPQLEHYLTAIKPDIIIHLAAISSSKYAMDNPLETLNSNGMVVAEICEIIHRNRWKTTKFFNASSSEIYKGHVQRDVAEDDTHTYHNHPYSIAKILGKSVVEFYRDMYGHPFSNGVIFTTESPLKRPEFLLNKVAKHIREWSNTRDPLYVGNLDSHRTIIHASDVATAIRTIVVQPVGDTYLICSTDKSRRVYDLVANLFDYAGIPVSAQNNTFYDDETNRPILVIQDDVYKGFENNLTNISGTPTKLLKLGWTPHYTTEMILKELVSA